MKCDLLLVCVCKIAVVRRMFGSVRTSKGFYTVLYSVAQRCSLIDILISYSIISYNIL